ncbi:hypothetical protein RCL1_003877 [Eukaryota sp. TZLM3-RCL]
MLSFLVVLLLITSAFADTSCCNDGRCVYSTDSFNQDHVKDICGDDVHACRMTCDSLPDFPPVIGCVTRATIMSRAQRWVNEKVPFSQYKIYGGYRTDAFGFISMSWILSQPGERRQSIMEYAHRISKNDLQPGDALIADSIVVNHIVLFGGWANSGKSEYYSYEQHTSKGAIRRKIPYSYWTPEYIPIRLNNVC